MILKLYVTQLIKYIRSEQGISTLWAFLGLSGQTFLQFVYIIFVARILGADFTGILFIIVSVALIASSFVGFGGGGLVLRDTSRDKSNAHIAYGRAKVMSYITFPFFLPLVVIIAWYITKGQVSIWAIILIGSSDLLATRLLTTSWSLFVALEEHVRASLLLCTMPLARLFVLLLTVFWPGKDQFMIFSLLYFIASFSVIAGVFVYVRSRIGKSPLSIAGYDRAAGLSFSLTWLNTALQTESDKLLLGLFSSPAIVAVYGVASRLMDGAAMPSRALRVSITSRLFREGASGHFNTYKLILKVLPLTIIYGVFAWVGFWLLAPFFVRVFGQEFSSLASILPILGALPLLRAISDFGAEVFMASDRPYIQATTQTVATVLRVTLGFLLIGSFQLEGAVATALIVSFITGVILWSIAWKISCMHKHE